MISIDQNSHSLWDTLPKLQALAAAGVAGMHYVEDIDVAFTQLGQNAESQLQLARERFYPSGGQDWGAGLFYTEFLGRLPIEPRDYQSQLGAKIVRAGKSAGIDLQQLYDTYAVSDNWQLIGSSYVAGGDYHRVIGDVSVSEVREFLFEILTRAENDTLAKFPHLDCRARAQKWFSVERTRVENLMATNPGESLPQLYGGWLGEHGLGNVKCSLTSQLFDLNRADENREALLELFLRDYSVMSEMYNRAITESNVGLNELKTTKGELPFFAVLRRGGHLVRTTTSCDDGKLVIDGESFAPNAKGHLPLEQLSACGILGLPGKAVTMGLQVRMLDNPAPLVLPENGSLYFPATHRFEQLLAESGLLPQIKNIAPIVRVGFGLLDRLTQLPREIAICLPEHLAAAFGCDELPAADFAENYRGVAAQAAGRLESFKQRADRDCWIRENFPRESQELNELHSRRAELGRANPKDPQIRELHARGRELETQLQRKFVQKVFTDAQVSQLGYYNSRGAILPWAYALGGADFYDTIIRNAEIFEEHGKDMQL
ncbi:MAG: hypothetical protein KAR11_01760 [Phycisphaerae bacterium]|nr:hypothetical protein [Phycisphaerae bacterium]